VHPHREIIPPVESLLDVGCNVGAWLADCRQGFPAARLAGVEINDQALAIARHRLPGVALARAAAERLPFADASFQYVTCFEVLEHIPPSLRAAALAEMRRVLRTRGRLVLTVPHAGWFAWLDANNVRFRTPQLYAWLIGRSLGEVSYATLGRSVEWHHHFALDEIAALAGRGWRRVAVRYGGLLLAPVMAWLSWPWFRMGAADHPIRLFFERVAAWEYARDYGRASYGLLVVFERQDDGIP
jgi:SAM-dependent methyltransferase